MTVAISVLLVDDDESLASATCKLLGLLGFAVTWKADRAQAVQAICAPHSFDVMLLDLRLGRERGERVITEARSRGCLIPPVVILSAQPDAELREAAHLSKAKGVLRKPCTANDMRLAIEHALV
jgi:CheY-like chemotaxis protein